MLFNTARFFVFLAVVLALFYSLPHRYRKYLLLAASYYFYSRWNPYDDMVSRFLGLLVLSTVMDYACGLAVDRIEDPWKRKLFVALSMALNLGMLGYFKYYNFFAESLHAALARGGVNVSLTFLQNVVLPIGISFYTFQSMSYVIDVYRKDIKPTRNLIEFATFVSFFPHLVAGPIVRGRDFLPQINRPKRWTWTRADMGLRLILLGIVKKLAVADRLAHLAGQIEPLARWRRVGVGVCDYETGNAAHGV